MAETQKSEPKKKRSPYKISAKRAKLGGILCLAVIAVILFLMSPFFDIETIKVEGNVAIEASEIIKASGISKGDNIFAINSVRVEEGVTNLGKIASVRITRSLPSKITLTVDERTECAYIKEKGTYIAIDETGRVLITSSGLDAKIPVVQGIKTVDSEKGQFVKLDSSNAKAISDLMVCMLTELKEAGILSDIKTIDLSNLSNIRMTLTNNTLVNMGEDGEEASNSIEYKIAYLKAIIPELPESQNGGVIELSDTENVTSRMS